MRISDPRAIRALAHPLRLDLIELLAAIAPATAARCARILGESQASCSFHLRQLAKYGFVEDAGPGDDKRERLWRATDRRFGPDRDADPAVAREFGQVVVARESARFADYIARADDEPPEWRAGGGFIASTLPVTAEEAAELREQWRKIISPYAERATELAPGQRYVRFYLAASPLPEIEEQKK